MTPVIDVCCGGRAMYFNKDDARVTFCDKRVEPDLLLCNGQHISIQPDIICDFKELPFEDNSFYLAVFDPPHLIDKSDKAWLVQKYGSLPADFKTELKAGFDECMRVLKPNGTLIFKWNEAEVKTSELIELFGQTPLFGHRSGKRMNTQWLVYLKGEKQR